MENWGCVTYRTVCLLVDEKNTALKNKQYVAIVVAHELAHQWFGNLVTMEWWTELWLNEGFASWVEYLAVDKLFPEWKVWQSFVNDAHNPALGLDGLLTSHPIEVPVKHPSEIDEIFDAISYLKGAAVIRMLASHLGLETFRKGLVAYLQKFAYKNATTVDLWQMLEIGGKLPEGSVSSLMANWTAKMGYPVLSVEAKEGGFSLGQQHFVSSGDKGHDTLWQVPVVYELYDGKNRSAKKMLLKGASENMEEKGKYTCALFNQGSQAYYRVKYGPKLRGLLFEGIKAGVISDPVDRLAIQADLMAIVKAGVDESVTSKEYFDLIKAYKNETEFIVWESLLANIQSLSVLAKAAGFQEAFSKYMVELLQPIAEKLGWDSKEGEPATDQMLRAQVIPLIGIHGHPPTVKKALDAFTEFYDKKQYTEEFKGKSALPADFRSGVYRIAVKQNGEKAFEQLLMIYKTTTFQEEKVRILRSIGAGNDDKLIERTLAMSLDFKQVRKQDMMYPIFGTVGSEKGLRATWAFLKKNWSFILKEFKGTHMLVRLASVTSRFAMEEDQKDVEEFFKSNEHPGAERKVKQCLESIGTNARWLKRDRGAIAAAVGAA
uniref:Alpha-aminoacylpeptide hydrolase n=2 Tax=Lotharella globosa TaxID=91324 RepID=A0A7S4E1N5_9EUKA